MHKHHKLNEIALKDLIYHNISDSNNKIKLIIYSPKFNTTNLTIYNNFSSLTSHLSMFNVVYEFKCFSYKISADIGLTTSTL